jgi:hypothetical protein
MYSKEVKPRRAIFMGFVNLTFTPWQILPFTAGCLFRQRFNHFGQIKPSLAKIGVAYCFVLLGALLSACSAP